MNKAEKTEIKPARAQVAALAYQLWEKGGRQSGRDQQYWLQAEKQLCATPAQTPVPEVSRKALAETASTDTTHRRHATNGRLQNHLASP